jgi:sulfopyruvate decarboxylase subunit beta
MEAFAEVRGDAAVITGPGATSGALWAAEHHSTTLYNMEMGYAAAVGLGVALAARGRRVVAMEGEGSMVAGMAGLSTIGRFRPPNLTVVVFDNGVFGTGSGTVETATRHGTDLVAVARACGIDRVALVDDVAAAREVLPRAMSEGGPWFLVARIEATDAVSGTRPTPGIGHVESAEAFRRGLAEGT